MNREYTINIPYESRSEYVDIVCTINEIVTAGQVTLFVSNMPYFLKAQLFVSTSNNSESEKIDGIINDYQLEIIKGKNMEHFFEEAIEGRKWDMIQLPLNVPKDILGELFFSAFVFAEKNTLKNSGYDFDIEKKSKSIFISYCHRDKKIVNAIEHELSNHNVFAWIDTQEIGYGDNILEKMLDGISKTDIALVFLSEAFITSAYGKFELNSFWNSIILNNKEWFLVRLDDVDLDKIYPILKNYKYYDYRNETDLSDLIRNVVKRAKV
jgi:TIR domain.